MVVAPHPDDESLGCGGTLLRHRDAGDETHWLIATAMQPNGEFDAARIAAREQEIDQVAARYGFASVTRLDHPTAGLDIVPRAQLVGEFAETLASITPDTLYLPHRGDAHSDHRITFDAAAAAAKPFRAPYLARILSYEVASETDAAPASSPRFDPAVFVDISHYLDDKVSVVEMYAGETGAFPFPRSARAIRALAQLRGSQSGYEAAEAYMLLRERR